METKKVFLGKDYEETKFKPVLSEFLEMIAWDAQHQFSNNFGGLFASLNSQPRDTFGVDYIWVDREEDTGRNADELRFRKGAQFHLDNIRESVRAIGVLDKGNRILSFNYGEMERHKRLMKSFNPDEKLISQVKDIFLEEQVINGNLIWPNNIFYYRTNINPCDDFLFGPRKSKVWLKTISKAYEEAQNMKEFIDLNANISTRVLALEGIKSLMANEL